MTNLQKADLIIASTLLAASTVLMVVEHKRTTRRMYKYLALTKETQNPS